MSLADLRKEYSLAGLTEKDLARDPFRQFEKWFQEAEASKLVEPNAMVLSTAARDGRPSGRTVLLKNVDGRGFVFYTNYESRKGRELDGNPRASLVFPWFGDHPSDKKCPAHGFARDQEWRLVHANPGPEIVLETADDAASRAWWPHAYRLRLSDTSYARWSSVAVPVSARVSLAASSAKLRNGQTVTLTGRVTGAPAGSHKLVQLQAQVGRSWVTFASTRLSNGTFTYRYRFTRTTGAARYAFRARVVASSDWPLSTGVSATRTVKVTGPNGHKAKPKVKAGR